MGTGKYRKLVLTDVFYRSWVRRAGLVRIYVVGLEIIYLVMHFWTTGPTDGSQGLANFVVHYSGLSES
jgi:hypothetical protein